MMSVRQIGDGFAYFSIKMFSSTFYERIPVGKRMYLFVGAYGNLNSWDLVIRDKQYSLDQEVASKVCTEL